MQRLVQGFQCRGMKLLARLAESLGGNDTGFKGGTVERLKEAIQFGLQGAVGLIQQKQNQIAECQKTFAGKMLWVSPVLGNKLGAAQ